MANLRGGTHQKQVRDAIHRMGRIGQSKHLSDSNNSHSIRVQENRESMLKDFVKYAQDTLNIVN